jgi:PAS domain S-box-containing protein
MTVRDDIERYADRFPAAVCLLSEEGYFLIANAHLRELLRLPRGDISSRTITEFYVTPTDWRVLRDTIRGGIEKRAVTFSLGDRDLHLHASFNAVLEEGAFVGFCGVLFEQTTDIDYQRFLNSYLPSGVYRLDENDVVTAANLGFANLLGYDHAAEITGRNICEFYANANDAYSIREQIIRGQVVRRDRVRMRRAGGEEFLVYMTAVQFSNSRQMYTGCGGIIEDRSRDEQYDRLLANIPVGFYAIRHLDGKDIVIDCNEEFAHIFGAPSCEEIIGRDVRSFHYSQEETTHLLRQLTDAVRTGGPVLGHQLRIRAADGTVKVVEVNARPYVRNGLLAGRVGAVRDITDEVEMRHVITDLTGDIGAVLHTFRHTLAQLKHSISSVANVLAGKPKTKLVLQSPEDLEASIQPELDALLSASSALTYALDDVTHSAVVEPRDRDRLLELISVMRSYKEELPTAHWRDVWRNGSVEILAICERLFRAGAVARSILRSVVTAAKRIATITGLATLSVAREAIVAVEASVAALNEFVTSGIRETQIDGIWAIEQCVADAINNLSGFAEDRKVRIRFEHQSHTQVRISRIEMARAIGNLLHNALKYSWRRDDGKAWVTISVANTQQATVQVVIENWGVPIPEEELESGLIFRLGFRGRFSSDRGRMGTGVGLADSLRVVERHHGALRIASRPAGSQQLRVDYDQPFITTAVIELPLTI